MRNKSALLSVAVTICLALQACSGLSDWLLENDIPPTPAPAESPASTMPVLPTGAPQSNLFGVSWSGLASIQPLINDSRFDALWLPLVYEGLFKLDDSFQALPVLCAQYQTTDSTTFVFTLRTGVVFHDGTPLAAKDVVWSLNQAVATQGPYADRLADVLQITELSDISLEVVLSAPNPRLPALLTVPIVAAGSDILDIAPGTGPFMPVFDDPEYPSISIFGDWWQRLPMPLSRLELIQVTSGDQLIYNFEASTLSMLLYNPSAVSDVRFRGDYESWEYDTPVMEFIGFNTTTTHTGNPLVRGAVLAGIDRAAISLDMLEPRPTVPATLPINPACPAYDRALAQAYGFDPGRMAGLLAEAGYEDADGDGVLEVTRGRRVYPLELTMVVSLENPHYTQAARVIAKTLTDAGVFVDLRELSSADYIGAVEGGDFDMYYGAATVTPDFSPLVYFSGGSLGYGGYDDAETRLLWEEAALPGASDQTVNAFWKRFADEAPIAPIQFQRQELLLQRGLTSDPDPTWENVFYNLSSWEMS